jgi:transposase
LHKKDMEDFFADLLHLSYPFKVGKIEKQYNKESAADKQVTSIYIYVALSEGWQVEEGWKIHSWHERKWRHLSLFEYPCYIICRLPVLQNKISKQSKQLEVSWARPYSGFTLLFEQAVLAWIRHQGNITSVATMFGEYPQRIRYIYDAYTQQAYEQRKVEAAERIGIDETSTHKGHSYISLFVDMDKGKILAIEDGRDGKAIAAFVSKVDGQSIQSVSMDMSPAFVSAVATHLPQAGITFDKFHVLRHIYKGLGKLADTEQKYMAQTQLEHLYRANSREEMAAFLAYWIDLIKERLHAGKLAKSLKRHFEGIINYAQSRLNNGLLEGINSKIQTIKRLARGFRYTDNFKRMILFVFGTIQPTKFT